MWGGAAPPSVNLGTSLRALLPAWSASLWVNDAAGASASLSIPVPTVYNYNATCQRENVTTHVTHMTSEHVNTASKQ